MEIVSDLPMAMGTDEQQAVHPFFRQEFGLPVKPTPLEELSTADINTNDPRPDIPYSATDELPQDRSNADTRMYKPTDEGPMTGDEDQNEGRRKRRRMNKPKASEPTATATAGLSAWLGVSSHDNKPSTGDQSNEAPSNLPTPQVGTPPAEPLLPNATQTSVSTENEQPKVQTARSSSRQKTLKLNSKGSLLSSPASSPPPDAQKTRKGRPRKALKSDGKLVTLKYALNTEKNMGKLIDDILNGPAIPKKPVVVPAVQPRKTKSQKLKPTHPFFNKNSAPNSGPESASDSQQAIKGTASSPAGTPDRSRVVPASESSFTRPPRRVSKFPELVHPLWPPRDLVHVRDNCSTSATDDRLCHVSQDRKKSKLAAISIRDQENVLLCDTAEARRIARLSESETRDTLPILRHPMRHVASSKVLQAAMERQMSWSSPNRQFHWGPSTPPLAKLRSALLSSASAIDLGKYENQLWTQKYAPKSADDVLQLGREPQMLRDWLCHLRVTAVDTGKSSKENAKSKSKRDKKHKKRRKTDELDGFVVSSGEEASEMDNVSGSDDELAGDTPSIPRTVVRSGDMFSGSHGAEKPQLSNAILISGPAGCGKTASVHAIAKELDFEIFEINAGSRRNARDMLERVGDMTQNHLVHLLNESDGLPSSKVDSKPNKLMNFFKGPSAKAKEPAGNPSSQTSQPETGSKQPREQKQSLILLEEADILFEEDRQFWTGVFTLISQSKRPIIITCNDESLIPTQEMSLHAILRYQKPSPDFCIDYLLLVAANEGHILKRESVTRLFQGSGLDIRKSLMDLNFWCQMGVGSEKSGLDWLLPAWPPESNLDHNGDRLRVLSLNTYERYMGWFNRDLFLSHNSLEGETEIISNCFHWWGLGLQESEDMAGKSKDEVLPAQDVKSSSRLNQLDILGREADYYDMRSSLDILCSNFTTESSSDLIDVSAPPLPEGYRSNYLDNYPVLQTQLRTEYSSLSETISTTYQALLNKNFRPTASVDIESAYANRPLSKTIIRANPPPAIPSTLPQFQRIFESIMRANYSAPTPTARHAPSFENGIAPITEDLAPYIRAIMVFDGRLMQYRNSLFQLQEPGPGEKRSRNTRASRAALEGGDKASVRKDRWFTVDAPYYKIQATAGPTWQQILFDMGYFRIGPTVQASLQGDQISGPEMDG
ncbi:hypothetical protein N7452_009978 [Penicillium brevicompactum]|uniref:AAA+ ATPase domain-containing protein n=1 Tax=Penicillium brevicompactum TaxID=5074 RepID=A0A9W9QCI8_PENBR|nr:hypothetical protein N7452_009978 [Penicillium brevicompactum]